MPSRVEIVDRKQLLKQGPFRVDDVRFRFEKYDGEMSGEVERFVLERGDAVVAVVHDSRRNEVLLCEQFRIPAHEKGPGWLLELPAGMLDEGEEPEECARREVLEETGFKVDELRSILTFYSSPGCLSERLHLVYCKADLSKAHAEGGGLDHENEDIRTVVLSVDEAISRSLSGAIQDGKSLVGLLWLASASFSR